MNLLIAYIPVSDYHTIQYTVHEYLPNMIALIRTVGSKQKGHSMPNQHKKYLTLLDLDETWFLHRPVGRGDRRGSSELENQCFENNCS